jgi:hypothetical protein
MAGPEGNRQRQRRECNSARKLNRGTATIGDLTAWLSRSGHVSFEAQGRQLGESLRLNCIWVGNEITIYMSQCLVRHVIIVKVSHIVSQPCPCTLPLLSRSLTVPKIAHRFSLSTIPTNAPT